MKRDYRSAGRTATPAQIRGIMAAARELSIDDETLRLMVRQIGGASSKRELSLRGAGRILDELRRMGASLGALGGLAVGNDHQDTKAQRMGGVEPLYASSAQVELIGTLARLRGLTPEMLQLLCLRVTRRRESETARLRPREAAGVIEALKAMHARDDGGGGEEGGRDGGGPEKELA